MTMLTRPLSLSFAVQVWNSAGDEFVSQNKQTGRKIKTSEFNTVLASFISDGDRLLVHHIPNILRKLWRLASILHKLPGFRFYGCSLLFIYDGDPEIQEQLRIATEDNLPLPSSQARKTLLSSSGLTESSSAATIVVGGAATTTTVEATKVSSERPASLRQQHHHHHHHQDVPEPTRRRRDSETFPERRSRSADASDLRSSDGPASSTSGRTHPRHANHSSTSYAANPPQQHPSTSKGGAGGEIKIRIVDFAHTTTGKDFLPLDPSLDQPAEVLGKGYDAPFDPATGKALARFPPVHRDKPDEGFIFGIRKLCDAFVAIWETERLARRKAVAGEGDVEVVQLPRLDLGEGDKVWRRVMEGKGWEAEGYLST